MENESYTRICDKCREQARLMLPSYSVMVRSNPGYPQTVRSSAELIERNENEDVCTVEIKAMRPTNGGTYYGYDIFYDLEEIRGLSTSQIETDTLEKLAYRLHREICKVTELNNY